MDGWMDGPADSIENTDIYIYPCCAVTGEDAAHGQIRSYPWVLEQHNEYKTVLTRSRCMHGATGCWIRDAIVLACSLHLKLEASDVESNGTQEARNPGPSPPECGLERPPPGIHVWFLMRSVLSSSSDTRVKTSGS